MKLFDYEYLSVNNKLVGNKAYYLYKLINVCSIPRFITISSNEFLKQLELKENNSIKEKIVNSFVSGLGIATVLPQIQNNIMNMYITDDWIYNVFQCLEKNKVEESYAVRSSSVFEDGLLSSGAGVFESYTKITRETLIHSIKKCWASMFNLRAIHYYDRNKNILDNFKMGVIIQHYETAEKAGVLFSKDPICPSNGIRIEYVSENSEDLMCGAAEANSIWPGFYDSNNNVVRNNNNEKWVNMLIDMVQTIKKHMNFEIDVEWVLRSNKIYIVQCRPITTIQVTSQNTWMLNFIDAVNKSRNELDSIEFDNSSIRKKLSLYDACNKANVSILGWYILRYSKNSDLDDIVENIVNKCGLGFYSIMLNSILSDFQCDYLYLKNKLIEILDITGLSVVTVSIRYIPLNQFSAISYYDIENDIYRIEFVPGVMKGLKSGCLDPSYVSLDSNFNVIDCKYVEYNECYEIDMDTDTFSLVKNNYNVYDVNPFIEEIAKYTKKLFENFILGAIEFWICDKKVWVTDYSLKVSSLPITSTKKDYINFIYGKQVEGVVVLINKEDIEQLECLSYSKAVSVNQYDNNVIQVKKMQELSDKILSIKKNGDKIILATEKPYLSIIPLLNMVDGVVLKNASKLCHLSVILMENGVPSVEINEQFDDVKDGDIISFGWR